MLSNSRVTLVVATEPLYIVLHVFACFCQLSHGKPHELAGDRSTWSGYWIYKKVQHNEQQPNIEANRKRPQHPQLEWSRTRPSRKAKHKCFATWNIWLWVAMLETIHRTYCAHKPSLTNTLLTLLTSITKHAGVPAVLFCDVCRKFNKQCMCADAANTLVYIIYIIDLYQTRWPTSTTAQPVLRF